MRRSANDKWLSLDTYSFSKILNKHSVFSMRVCKEVTTVSLWWSPMSVYWTLPCRKFFTQEKQWQMVSEPWTSGTQNAVREAEEKQSQIKQCMQSNCTVACKREAQANTEGQRVFMDCYLQGVMSTEEPKEENDWIQRLKAIRELVHFNQVRMTPVNTLSAST